MNKDTNVRYTPPSKYDVAHYGMIFKVVGENDSCEYFVQCSSNLEAPDWKPFSYLLEQTFMSFVDNKEFISLCLAISFGKTEERAGHLKELSNLVGPK